MGHTGISRCRGSYPPRVKSPRPRQPIGWYVAWVGSVVFAFFGLTYASQIGFGYDSHAYWSAIQDMDHLYGAPALSRDAYLYSPAFAQALWPLGRLPWPVFWLVWSGLLLSAFVWLLRPLAARWFAPAMVAVVPEIVTGNIYALMAVAIVLGTSRGSWWSFLALTKVTPGMVGFAWFVGERRWRALAEAVATTAGLVVISCLTLPQQWRDWVDFLRSGTGASASTLGVVLLVAALALAVFGAVTRRPWVLPVAVILASPTFGVNTLTLLAAAPRLRSSRDRERRFSGPGGARPRARRPEDLRDSPRPLKRAVDP